MTIDLADEAATAAMAGTVAKMARPGDVIALSGDLGSGKTVFARAFIHARTGTPEDIPSPTYTLVQTYDDAKGVAIYHFDLFRIEATDELEELGMEDAFAAGISLIEWPDRMGALLPADRLDVSLSIPPGQGEDAGVRQAALKGHGPWADRVGDLVEMGEND